MLDRLEKLAREATPGPWEAYTDCPGECCWLIRKPEPDRQEWESMNAANGITWPETSREDAAYIAAADPATVLKMIAAIRAAKLVDATSGDLFWADSVINAKKALRDALAALEDSHE